MNSKISTHRGEEYSAPRRGEEQIASHLRFLKHMGVCLGPAAKVLDFGCGRGNAVTALMSKGFDAYGVDAHPWWSDAAEGQTTHRLRIIPPNGPFPFPDGFFDLCLSDQVLEHVFDYVTVFREIGRVLKPGALSIHRFPGPNTLVDGHTGIPFPALCHFKPYLALWAIAGHRASSQRGIGWREALTSSIEIMGGVNYPTKRRLKKDAAMAGVIIEFLEAQELALREVGMAATLRRCAKRYGLDKLAVMAMSCVVQRYMVLRSGSSASRSDPSCCGTN